MVIMFLKHSDKFADLFGLYAAYKNIHTAIFKFSMDPRAHHNDFLPPLFVYQLDMRLV